MVQHFKSAGLAQQLSGIESQNKGTDASAAVMWSSRFVCRSYLVPIVRFLPILAVAQAMT